MGERARGLRACMTHEATKGEAPHAREAVRAVGEEAKGVVAQKRVARRAAAQAKREAQKTL